MADSRNEQKKLEERILERLKKQVFDKDQELKSHQNDASVRDATKEALAEMTSLEKEDVEKIYQKIRQEEIEKSTQEKLARQANKKRLYITVFVFFIIGASVAYYFLRPAPVLFSFIEDFETGQSVFINEEDFKYKKSIENGEFVYENNIDEWCYWNSSPKITFPKNYTVEAKSNWKNGSYGTYGINLVNNNDNFMVFSLTKEGKTNVSVRHYDKYTDNDWNYKIFTDKSDTHTQRIEVRDGKYNYFIDDKFVRKGNLAPFSFYYVGFRLCDRQTVGFERISVRNDDTGEYILQESFENPTSEMLSNWDVENKFNYNFSTQNGKFVMSHQEEEYCHRSDAFLPDIREDENWELSADVTWKEGESKDFGILFISTYGEMGQFMISNTGKVVFKIVGQDNKITYSSNYTPSGFVSKGEDTYHLVIKHLGEGKLSFFVNDRKVLTDYVSFKKVEKIGMITCGEQVVEFDNVKYEEK
ncbi:hypothetical protein [Bernardetia sp.]|uniref:hypothetical protein n=1 Tax=Bernardetia sp. TaxID=1937974 RepID=UPI0025C1E8B2|nr:hypothetical protein [Bernardetia sp.]